MAITLPLRERAHTPRPGVERKGGLARGVTSEGLPTGRGQEGESLSKSFQHPGADTTTWGLHQFPVPHRPLMPPLQLSPSPQPCKSHWPLPHSCSQFPATLGAPKKTEDMGGTGRERTPKPSDDMGGGQFSYTFYSLNKEEHSPA